MPKKLQTQTTPEGIIAGHTHAVQALAARLRDLILATSSAAVDVLQPYWLRPSGSKVSRLGAIES